MDSQSPIRRFLLQTGEVLNRRGHVVFLTLWCAALMAKLLLAPLLGTLDVWQYARYGSRMVKIGVAATYGSDEIVNFTPMLAGYSAMLTMWVGTITKFAFFLKLPGIIAESIFAIVLWKRYGKERGLRRWIGLFVVLNPIALGVTGYHGNFDGLLAVLLGMAILAAMDSRVVACAIWYGLATNVKVAPVLLGPVFFFWWLCRGRALTFSWVSAVTVLVGWSPGILADPKLFFSKVIAYSSLWGTWGISRVLYLTGSPDYAAIVYGGPSQKAKMIGAVLKVIIIAGTCALAWRRRKETGVALAGTVAAVWTLFFVLAPGGAPQYMVWPVFPLLLWNMRVGIFYLIAATPFMLIFYPLGFNSLLPMDLWPVIIQKWPSLAEEFAFTWPALVLWVAMIGILIREWSAWWKGGSRAEEIGEVAVEPNGG